MTLRTEARQADHQLLQSWFYTQRKEAGLQLFINVALKLQQGGPATRALLSSWARLPGWGSVESPQNDPPYLAVQDPWDAVRKKPAGFLVPLPP